MEEAPDSRPMRQSDHDLLVSIHTKVERVIVDVKELNQNIGSRLSVVEATKVDRIEWVKGQEDHERRIRNLERYVWLAIGALAILQFLIKTFL